MNCEYCGAIIFEGQKCQDLYYTLSYYTLNNKDKVFVHQYIVDAYGAQHANKESKPIRVAFALIGLYLFAEKGYSGREVQQAHMQLARGKSVWPKFVWPTKRGSMNVADVLKFREGKERDEAIKQWAKSVWEAYADSRTKVINLLAEVRFKDLK